MSAEILRRAAALMRERSDSARKVTGSSDWHAYIRGEHFIGEWGVRSSGGHVCQGTAEEEAEHIASWHPAVALAVADWLDCVAAPFDQMWEADEDGILWGYDLDGDSLRFDESQDSLALAVARTYLGSES